MSVRRNRVVNPLTGRMIQTGSRTYMDLLRRGYIVDRIQQSVLSRQPRQIEPVVRTWRARGDPTDPGSGITSVGVYLPEQNVNNRYLHYLRTTIAGGRNELIRVTEHAIYSSTPLLNPTATELRNFVIQKAEELAEEGLYIFGMSRPEILSSVLISEPQRVQRVPITQIQMQRLFTEYAALREDDDAPERRRYNDCVLDYILSVNRQEHVEQTRFILGERPANGYTIGQILKYCREKDQSLYILDAFLERVVTHVATGVKRRSCLAFVVRDNHLYPLRHARLRRIISHASSLDISELGYLSRFPNNDDCVIYEGSTNVDRPGVHILFDQTPLEALSDKEFGHLILSRQGDVRGISYQNRMIISADAEDYYTRKAVCQQLNAATGLKYYTQFRNFGFSSMARSYFAGYERMMSELNKFTKEIFAVKFGPVHRTFVETPEDSLQTTLDINKSYTYACLSNQHPIPVYGYTDHPAVYDGKPISPGMYWVRKLQMDEIEKSGWIPSPLVEYALEGGYLDQSQIRWQLRASKALPADTLKDFVERTQTYMGESDAKMMINNFIGSLGCVEQFGTTKGSYSTDFFLMCAMALPKLEDGYTVNVNKIEGRFYLTCKKGKLLDRHCCSVYRHIVAVGIANLHRLRRVYPNRRVIAMHTDSVTFEGRIDAVSSNAIGGYRVCDDGATPGPVTPPVSIAEYIFPRELIPAMNRTVAADEADFITGVAGSGKTTTMVQMAAATPGSMILVPTHQVKQVILQKFSELGHPEPHIMTLAKAFGEGCEGTVKAQRLKWIQDMDPDSTVFIDEYTMCKSTYMRYLSSLRERGVRIRMFGDRNQLASVEASPADFWNNQFVKGYICRGKSCELPYLEATARYDTRMYRVLDRFLATGKVRHNFNVEDKSLMTNLAFTRAQCRTVNRNRLAKFNAIQEERGVETKQIGDRLYAIGCKMVCIVNKRVPDGEVDRGDGYLYTNNETFKISAFESDAVILEGARYTCQVPLQAFQTDFELGFCVTIHRAQGLTFGHDEHYNVYLCGSKSQELVYTALSRGRNLSQIHLRQQIQGQQFYKHDFRQVFEIKLPEFLVRDGVMVYPGCGDQEESTSRGEVPLYHPMDTRSETTESLAVLTQQVRDAVAAPR